MLSILRIHASRNLNRRRKKLMLHGMVQMLIIVFRRCPYRIRAKILDCRLDVVSSKSNRTITFTFGLISWGNVWISLSPLQFVKYYHCCLFPCGQDVKNRNQTKANLVERTLKTETKPNQTKPETSWIFFTKTKNLNPCSSLCTSWQPLSLRLDSEQPILSHWWQVTGDRISL